jgi:hypothetical protein
MRGMAPLFPWNLFPPSALMRCFDVLLMRWSDAPASYSHAGKNHELLLMAPLLLLLKSSRVPNLNMELSTTGLRDGSYFVVCSTASPLPCTD